MIKIVWTYEKYSIIRTRNFNSKYWNKSYCGKYIIPVDAKMDGF